ncbi:hypothetical protein BTJ39_05100 [Izhakiella australiensis]|uniref:Uncharacterized protein n=1 Tax=Izhakiella australiensis TaxID=1926881 RepID=A0A1S8YR93_9GAMM|nr:hypothetical protein [Izhakiella australiensis]OON41342.1 hypothetical protein BTJ39_05100 [Izhakiella australiensis]
MDKKFSQTAPAKLRWKSARLVEKTGKWPLAAAAIPLLLAGYWQLWLAPDNARQLSALKTMQQQLKAPLPVMAESDEPALQTALSVTEYQQVKMLFAILARNKLQVEGSSYHFPAAGEEAEKNLKLSIPLRGSWSSLAQALQEITRVLPVAVERLDARRTQADVSQLSITLQLTLHRGQA